MNRRPLSALVLALLVAGVAAAQEPKFPDAKEFDKLVYASLRDVHNVGADLYNEKKQYEGAYRVYLGALRTLKPLLPHHPAAQKLIDDGFAAADQEPVMALKAFKLHEAIENVRTYLKDPTAAAKKKIEEKPKDKSDTKTKTMSPDAKTAATARVAGRVTFKGQPLPGGELALVSLDLAEPRVFTATLHPDATFAVKVMLVPGRYVVIVRAPALPAMYQTTTTSGLTIDVKPGANEHNFELK